MKKLTMFLALATMMFVLSACSGMTPKKDSVFANHTKVLVKPLDFKDAALDKITGDELVDFEKAQPGLREKYKQEFAKYAKETGYFEQIMFEGTPDAQTLVIEPKLNHLDPGIRGIMAATSSVKANLYDGATGKQVGKIIVQRMTGRQVWTSMMGSIEKLITELGEDTASKLGDSRL